jgi:DHA1 family inner membrane transport protein
MPSLMGILVALTVLLAVFAWTMHSTVAAVVTVFVWGIAAFATVAPLQSRVVHVAGDAPNLASTFNIAAFNLGNAGGAWLGGAVLAAGYAMPVVSLAGAAVTVAGLLATMASVALERRAVSLAAAGCA